MMIGTATVRCTACGTRHELPVQARPPQAIDGGAAVCCEIYVTDLDVVTLQLFAQAHRGPIEAAG